MDMPPKTLAVLIVEDTESDAQLIARLLKKAGYEPVYEQVETAEQMRAALDGRDWDVIISDYKMPQFDGLAALKLLHETGHDVPFIVVSGTIGEETAVSMMKAGAHDYLIKGNLARFVPAVERELGQAAIRREQKRIEEARAASESELRALFASMQDVVMVIDRQGVYRKIAPTKQELLVGSAEELLGKNLRDVFPAEQVEYFIQSIQQVLETKQTIQVEYELLINNKTTWFEASISPMDEDSTLCVARDVTERIQAARALAASEAELRALVEQAPAIVYTESAETRETIYISGQLEKVTGYTAAEWMQDRDFWKSIIHPDDLPAVLEVDARTNATHDPFHAEYRIMTRDGRAIWIHDEATIIQDRDGTSLFWQGVMYDITKRKQSEEALRVSEARYRELFNSMIDGFALHEIICDDSGKPVDYRFLEVNPAFERLTGLRAENVVGKTALEALPNTEKYWIEAYGNVALTGRSAFYENYSRDLGRYFEVSAYCPRAGQFAVIMVDITERKLAEEGVRLHVAQLEILHQSGLALSQSLNPQEIGRKILELLEEKLNWHHTSLSLYNPQDDSLKLLDFNQPGLENEAKKCRVEANFNKLVAHSSDGLIGLALRQSRTVRCGDVSQDPHYIETYPGIRSGLYVPMKLGSRKIGVIGVESEQPDAFSEADEQLIVTLANQAASAFENARLFEEARQRVTQLEMLYQSGLALSQLLNPRKIGEKILELLEEKLNWRHTRIRLYHPQNDSLELLDFNQPGLNGAVGRHVAVERFQSLITHSGQGMSGWVVGHGQSVRSGDVTNDSRYVEAYPGIHSGLYVPMKLGERVVGVISIEDEKPDAFTEADERLILTLANQAASAFENARLFEEIRRRAMELETLNRISLVLRSVSKPEEMLSIVLDEALSILNTSHGSIELYNRTTDNFERSVTRGWISKLTEPRQNAREGIAGRVFNNGEIYISREFASDPETWPVARTQMPSNWGGICLPIHTTQQTLGVMIISVPSDRELDKDEIRLLSILSEMTGAALQRMQLHEQTVRRLEQLNALRAVDQAISSSLDMRLTLNILLTHTISQLKVDAADVLLLQAGSNVLELAAGRGFRTHLIANASLSNSFAGRAILERRSVLALDFAAASQNPQFGKFWEEEGFICYWCVPLVVKGEVKGVLEVYCRRAFVPDAEWVEFLAAFAGQAAIALDNTQLFDGLQRANMELSLAYDATIEGWSRALDLRDHETEGHTLRVAELTLKLARAMRVGESQLTAIRRGALLHDIGKMGVPDSILLKDGKLTDEEWEIMRQHPQLARDMLTPITYLNNALDIPYCHHEKWDGTGYPQGLKGKHIPLAARIFAVVDVWDALTNDRTYRKKWTTQKAREYIVEQIGKHFDPEVVEVFLRNVEEE
ncbi:Cyclic di-GMP phosphodiesterase [Anaerolineales bacterium]|nr:Cyclic di-GMP phosphodiesterase [Anaerolineales bacterium]